MATTSEYNTESFSYPADIMSDQYGGNYAMFFINVQSDSKLSMPTVDGTFDTGMDYLKGVKTGIASGLGGITTADAIYAQAAEAGLLAGGISLLGKTSEIGPALKNLVKNKDFAAIKDIAGIVGDVAIDAGKAAGVAGAITTGIAAGVGGFNKPVKRLKTAIALHMPTSLNIKYGVSYDETETSTLQGVNQLLHANNAPAAANAGAFATAFALNKAPGVLQALSKTAPNPMKEQIFKAVDNRTFSFSYRFAPRDETEAMHVLNIINQFKFHMHPEYKDDVGFLYIFPSEFDIVYYSGSEENNKIHKHVSCVLIEMSVNYTPNGVWSTFDNGMPTQIEMQLTFKELATLDKQKIQKGGF